jgi:hypothetical protein
LALASGFVRISRIGASQRFRPYVSRIGASQRFSVMFSARDRQIYSIRL